MKKSSKTKIISTVLTLSCTAVLLGFAASSVAWFSTNSEVKSSGMQVRCYLDETVGIVDNSYDIYGYDIVKDEPKKMTDLSLGDYDAFIEKNNTFARRFVRAKLYYPNTIKSGQKLEIKVECDANHLLKTVDSNNFIDKYISNLIEFNFLDNFDGSIPEEASDGSNVSTIYNQCVSEFDALGDTGISFVHKDKAPVSETTDKDLIITKTVALPASAVGVAGFTTDFFIEYYYNDVLVNYYRNNCEDSYGLDVFDGSNKIKFEKDIVSISFALTGGE